MNPIIARAEGISLITPGRLENLVRAVEATAYLPGDMAELGVYRGGSALVIAGTCSAKTLHLFDTFTGLPYQESDDKNPTGHDLSRGRFACAMEDVEIFLQSFRVKFHRGLFPMVAEDLDKLRFAFVHVDCDLYRSAIDAIEWFWPRVVPGGIMFFDDYGCDFTGVTDAVDEYFDGAKIQRQVEASNGIRIGCLVIKD